MEIKIKHKIEKKKGKAPLTSRALLHHGPALLSNPDRVSHRRTQLDHPFQGLFGCSNIHPNTHGLREIGVLIKLIYTSIHLNPRAGPGSRGWIFEILVVTNILTT
jgi:hypothetical protein